MAGDFRSDTVTKPTDAMRHAMFAAEVEDDVLGVDPTVRKLQTMVAEIFGKEAGLFVPTGTMANLISLLVHCEIRGSEVILGHESHMHYYEQGGMSQLGGIHPRPLQNKPDGTLDLQQVEDAIRKDDPHFPVTRLICIENTHNRCGGRVISVEYTDDVAFLAKKYGLKVHIDGARIFHAAIALKVTPKRLVQGADSVSICLSKGLGSPVGSVIVGSNEFINKAKRARKALGGGMRQVGVIAACGIISVTDMVDRLEVDHRNARKLAEALSKLKGLSVDVKSVETNLVYAEVTASQFPNAQALVDFMAEKHSLMFLAESKKKIRLVTHYHISEADVDHAISCFQDVFAAAE